MKPIPTGTETTAAELFEFEQLKGYPMLNWQGKRPFTHTHYYPSQLSELHGHEVDGWMNELYWGDNLHVMSHLLKKYSGKVDLIYIDPPFDSNTDYNKEISIKGRKEKKTVFKHKQYSDVWRNDEYLQFMYERLILCRELLSEQGSIFIQVDWRQNSYVRILMDEVFGRDCYRNEIRWKRQPVRGAKATSGQFARNSDTILYYSKSSEWTWNGSYKPYDNNFVKTKFRPDQNGRMFRDADLGDYSEDSIKEFEKQGKIYITSTGKKRLIRYLDEEKGESLGDLWTDIAEVNSMADERVDYPTQKPLPLLERIINACSAPGSLVFDCFMGSGTTQAAAMKLGRRFIGADINFGAIQTATRRLINIVNDGPGFAVYHINRHNQPFSTDSEAHIEIKKNKVLINNFYPINLLQKLSVPKDDLKEWKELIDSVMIDFNYNGSVFSPHIVDAPDNDNMVTGQYAIPKNAGNIKIRITDLLSETFEQVIEYRS